MHIEHVMVMVANMSSKGRV